MRKPIYSLQTISYEYENGKLSVELFNEIISGFTPDVWDYMMLSPNEPIDNCTCIQFSSFDDGTCDFRYRLEAYFGSTDDNTWKVYRSPSSDKSIAIQHFIEFWKEQKIPDISSWEDVTDEIG